MRKFIVFSLFFTCILSVVVFADDLDVEVVSDVESVAEESETGIMPLSDGSPAFSNAYYIRATDSYLGTVTLYIPSDRIGYFGYDANNYLVYLGSTSLSVYCSSVSYDRRVSFSSWGTGSYRYSSGSTTYTRDTHFRVLETNLQISIGEPPKYDMSDFIPYIVLVVGGVIFICFMMRSSR